MKFCITYTQIPQTKILIYYSNQLQILKIKGFISNNFIILPKFFKFNIQNSTPKTYTILFFYTFLNFIKKKQQFQLFNFIFLILKLIKTEIFATTQLYYKTLEIFGFGYRAYLSKSKKTLGLKLGYSHKNYIMLNKLQKFYKLNRYSILIFGTLIHIITKIANDIQKFKKPDIYKGKGIRFLGQKLKFKIGKKKQEK